MELLKTSISGIFKQYLKSGKITYYGKFRCPSTKKNIRKKLITKEKDLEKNLKECVVILDNIKNERKNYNSSEVIEEKNLFKNYLTLTELSKIYFDDRMEVKKRKLREQYNHLNDNDFNNFQVVKKKLYSVKNDSLIFKRNVESFDLGSMKLNTIRRKDIDNYIQNDLSQKNLSQKSKFNVFSQLKTIINFGIRKEITDIRNPFDNIKFTNPRKQRVRVLNESEIQLLLKECKEYKQNINIYLSVYLGVLTAARLHTVLSIKKNDIDIVNNKISLYNFKSNRQYQLVLNKSSIDWLKEKILPYYEDNEYIIRPISEKLRKKPFQPLSKLSTNVYKIMDRLFNKGLDKQNNMDRDKVVNFHTIRRSIGTNLVKNGTSVYNAMILLNHSSVEQTMKYLNITHNNLDKDINNLMNNIFTNFKD